MVKTADSKLIWAATRPEDGGVLYRAALGTTLPDMTDAPWDELDENTFLDHGWIGDDGVTNSVKRENTDHQAFGGDVVKTTQNKYTETLKVTCFESNETVLKSVFGEDNVTVDESSGHRQITVNHSSMPHDRSVWVVRTIDGSKTRLLRVQEGQLTDVADIVYVNKDLVKYTLTITCYKPDVNTDAVTELIDEEDVLANASS